MALEQAGGDQRRSWKRERDDVIGWTETPRTTEEKLQNKKLLKAFILL